MAANCVNVIAMYPDFAIGPLTVHTFGLMMSLGFLSAGASAWFQFRRRGLNTDSVYWLVILAAVGGILGAKLHYLLIHIDEMDSPWDWAFSGAGLVWYGGFIGGAAAVLIGIRLYRLPWGRSLDALAPSMAIGYTFGRLGCFFNGDDYGRSSTLPWAMEFPEGAPPTPAGMAVQPTQLYEAGSSLLIFLVLLYLSPRLKRPGMLACLYLVLAGIERFLVEFVRMQRDGQLQQQVLAAATAAAAAGVMVWLRRRPAAF